MHIILRCSAFPKKSIGIHTVIDASGARTPALASPTTKKGEKEPPVDGLCGQSPSPVPSPENFGIILTYNPSPPRRQHVGSTTYVVLCISLFTLDMFIRYRNSIEIVCIRKTRYGNIKKTCSSHCLITNSIEQKNQRERVETIHRLGVPAESPYVKDTQSQ